MNKLLVFASFILCSLSAFSQSNSVDSVTSVSLIKASSVEKFIIPELSVCIDSALNHSPLLKATDEQINIILEDLKIQKKMWLDFIIVDANTRYGLYNQLTLTQEASTADLAVKSDKEQFNYFAGITLRLPFSYFSNNKNEQKKLKLSIREAELRREDLRNEIRRLVVTEYFKLSRLRDLVDVHLNNLQTANIDYLKSKNDLRSGLTTMTEFAASSTAYAKAVDIFVSTKNEYYAQYYILNILIGANIQNSKK